MDKVSKTINVLQKDLITRIDWVYGTNGVPIQFEIEDFDVTGAAAVVYCLRPGEETPVKALCTVANNSVSFLPTIGFFKVGENMAQIRMTREGKDIISFKVYVECVSNILSDDAEEEGQETVLQQILSRFGELEGKINETNDGLNEKISESKNELDQKIQELETECENKYKEVKEKTESEFGQVWNYLNGYIKIVEHKIEGITLNGASGLGVEIDVPEIEGYEFALQIGGKGNGDVGLIVSCGSSWMFNASNTEKTWQSISLFFLYIKKENRNGDEIEETKSGGE